MKSVTDAPIDMFERSEDHWNREAEPAYVELVRVGNLDGLEGDHERVLLSTLIDLLLVDDLRLQAMLHEKIWALPHELARQIMILVGRDVLQVILPRSIKRIGPLTTDAVALHALDFSRQNLTLDLGSDLPEAMAKQVEERRKCFAFEDDANIAIADERGQAMISALQRMACGGVPGYTSKDVRDEIRFRVCEIEANRCLKRMETQAKHRWLLVQLSLAQYIHQLVMQYEMQSIAPLAERILFMYLRTELARKSDDERKAAIKLLTPPLAARLDVFIKGRDEKAVQRHSVD